MDDFFGMRALLGVVVLLGFGIRLAYLAWQEREAERKAKADAIALQIVRELNVAFDEETKRGGFMDPRRYGELDHLAEREGYGDR